MKPNLLIYILVVFSYSACSKKIIEKTLTKIDRPTFDCSNIPAKEGISTGWNFLGSDVHSYTSPFFNPNIGYEFIYFKRHQDVNQSKIYKFNLITKKKTLIYTGPMHFRNIEWTTNGWIIFNSGYLKKIRSDGTELTNITRIDDIFTTNEDKLLYQKRGSTPANQKYYFTDTNNQKIDSTLNIIKSVSTISWRKNNIVYSTSCIRIYNMVSKQIKNYACNFDMTSTSNKEWINDHELIWSNERNIFKTDINTNTTDTIVSHCNGFRYAHFSYSPQIDKIICYRITREKIGGNLLKFDSYIVMMNTDGTEKEIIDIENEFKRK